MPALPSLHSRVCRGEKRLCNANVPCSSTAQVGTLAALSAYADFALFFHFKIYLLLEFSTFFKISKSISMLDYGGFQAITFKLHPRNRFFLILAFTYFFILFLFFFFLSFSMQKKKHFIWYIKLFLLFYILYIC